MVAFLTNHSLLLMAQSPECEYTAGCLPVHLLTNVGVVFSFGKLQIKLLCTFLDKSCVGVCVFS